MPILKAAVHLKLPPAGCALLPGRRTGSPHLRLKPPEPSRALEPRLAPLLLLPQLAARPSASASSPPLPPAVPPVVLPAPAAVPPPLLLLFHSCLLSSLHPFTHNWLFRRWQVWTFSGQVAALHSNISPVEKMQLVKLNVKSR